MNIQNNNINNISENDNYDYNYNKINSNSQRISLGNLKKNFYENYDEKFNILKEKIKKEQNYGNEEQKIERNSE